MQLIFMEKVRKENAIEEGEETPHTIPFLYSKTGQPNVYVSFLLWIIAYNVKI